MRILITGASSLLGGEILRQLASDGQCKAVLALHRNSELAVERPDWPRAPLDVSDRGAVLRLIEDARPEAILHLSSLGSLDYCEKHPDEAMRVNVEGTRNIADAAKRCGARVLFSSTIYVFDGSSPPYHEHATPNPVNLYGETKLRAERIVTESDPGNAVLRLTTMYGWHSAAQRHNWVTWLVSKLKSGETVPVVTDVYSNNVWVGDAARCFLSALERSASGIFHVGGTDIMNRHAFSVAIAEEYGYPSDLLQPVTSERFTGLATRPSNTACTIDKIGNVLGVFPLGARAGLRQMRVSVSAYKNFQPRVSVG